MSNNNIHESIHDINDKINEIFEIIGRNTSGKGVSTTNLYKILFYIIKNKKGEYEELKKLCLTCAIGWRRLRENYIEPLEKWNIIKLYENDYVTYWNFNDITNQPIEHIPTKIIEENKEEKKEEKKERKPKTIGEEIQLLYGIEDQTKKE